MTNQASEDDLELIVARISAGIGGFGKLTRGTRYDGISEEAGIELLKAYIRTEKLKLLAEVRERVEGGLLPKLVRSQTTPEEYIYPVVSVSLVEKEITKRLGSLAKLEAEL